MHKLRLLLVLAACTTALAATGMPFMTLYPVKVTGGHLQSFAFIQDQRGLLYVANGSGVQEFDGTHWRMIPVANHTLARALARDASGRIYVGSARDFGYLAPDPNGSMRYISLLEQIPAAERDFTMVLHAHATPAGIYFQAREKLFLLQASAAGEGAEKWQVQVWHPDAAKATFTSSFYIDETLYLHQSGSGLKKMAGDSLVLLPGGAAFASDRIQLLLSFPGQPGHLLVGTDQRALFHFDRISFKPYATAADALLRSGNLQSGGMLQDGSLALSTLSNGFMIVDTRGEMTLHLTRESGLLSNTIFSVFVDRQDNVWLGMDGGIALLETGSALRRIPIASGGTPVAMARQGGQLYALATDGLNKLDPQTMQFQLIPETHQFYKMYPAGDEILLCGLEGVYRLREGRLTGLFQSDAATAALVSLHPAQDDPGRVLAGTTNGLITLRYTDSSRRALRKESAVAGIHEYIHRITEHEPGTYWLSTLAAGAIRLRFTQNDAAQPVVERFGPEQGLPVGTTSIYSIGDKLIFATPQGIYQFDDERQQFRSDPLFSTLALGANAGECVAATDAAGSLWINAGEETVCYRRDSAGNYQAVRGQFTRFNDEMVAAIYPEADGTVWFGTPSGVICLEPRQTPGALAPFQALIRSVELADDSTLWHGAAQQPPLAAGAAAIPFRRNSMTFTFSTSSYFKPEANAYRIWLEGFDPDWSGWNLDAKRNYTNLPAGRYTFHVQARNVFGQESTADAFAFSILTPWYDTWWAWILYLIGAAGLIAGVVTLRTRQLHQRSKALEAVVHERTAEIEQQKNSLEQQKNNIEQLSRIGKDITATLSIASIVQTVYENVNHLMDAPVLGIGLFNPEKETLDFPATIDQGRVIPAYSSSLKDPSCLAAWCFSSQQEVVINDYAQEYNTYICRCQPARGQNDAESLLYLPLTYKEKKIGVITAQSFRKHAYSDYHLYMLRNLATYSAIAVDNADAYHRLNMALEELKSTQEKLVTQSKLAALGALTAGIAHEIKNPLNFVNNFAVLMNDLVNELKEELLSQNGEMEPAESAVIEEILGTLQQNASKIIEHGKRADSIVRSMLLHSRGRSDERQPTDINAMLAEDLNLAYHGMRAQDSSFNVKLETSFDPSIGKLNIVPQDISRVFLNIITNGCYEVHRKKQAVDGDYSPVISIRTQNLGENVEIRIRDNGNGIPAAVRDKLFAPFFTTKPPGKGTGLGLSISFDIIVQEHSGQLTFETEEGQFAEFIITLPK